MARLAAGGARAQADYLKRFLADSIVRDFEHLRRTEFGGSPWVTLGQSYGGFLTLTYLSLFPEGVAASFTCGGIPHVPANATEVYEHTFPRMARKTAQFYERYGVDADRVAAVADQLPTVAEIAEAGGIGGDSGSLPEGTPLLPNGDPLTVERLQCLGSDFGMKPSFERVHWIFDDAFVDGDGSVSAGAALSDEFLAKVMNATSSRPLYWPLQEFIYANGELDEPIRWAAQRVRDTMPRFSTGERPLAFTGEAMFPWMFEQESALRPFKPAMDLLMEDTRFGVIYDADQLARNEVPLQSAVYFDDMYVDSGMQLDTLSRVGNSHYWVTNEFEHDGLHGDLVFRHLYDGPQPRRPGIAVLACGRTLRGRARRGMTNCIFRMNNTTRSIMAQNITIGFIGYGNMAQAIAQGLVDAGVVNGGDIVACAAHYDKLEASTAKLGARPLHNAREVAAAADVVIIAIKPYQIESVIKPIADEFAKNGRFVVSIAAGWDLAKYQKLFGDLAQSIHIQCTIPNTPMAVGKGVLVTETDNTLTDMQTEVFESLFGRFR